MSDFTEWAKAETDAERDGDRSPTTEPTPAAVNVADAATDPVEGPSDAGGPPPEPVASESAAADRDEAGKFKKQDPVQARINKAVKAQREAERKAADLEAKVREFEARSSQPAPEPPAPQPSDPKKPTIDQFLNDPDPYASLAEAMADYKVGQFRAQQQQDAAQSEALERVNAIVEAGRSKYKDFAEVMQGEGAQVVMPMPTLQALHSLENSEDVIYYLGQHADEARALAAHDLGHALLTLGALSAKVTAPSGSVTPAAIPSRAKPLIKPVGATPSAAADSPPDEKTSFAEHRRYWNEKERRDREAQRA